MAKKVKNKYRVKKISNGHYVTGPITLKEVHKLKLDEKEYIIEPVEEAEDVY